MAKLTLLDSRCYLAFKVILVVISVLSTECFARNANYYLTRWSNKKPGVSKAFTSPIVSPPSLPTSSPKLIYSPGGDRNSLQGDASSGLATIGAPVEGEELVIMKKNSNGTYSRDPRFFSLFNLVTIANTSCAAKTNDNGTCYSASECTSRGGAASGTCAQGLGTCCVFQQTCGGTTSQNCTYFVNENFPKATTNVGSCQLTVNKMNTNICQLRLDFDSFILSQPDTTDHQCLNDRFVVSGDSSSPIICGTNTGNHMYVDLGAGSSLPSVLTFITMGPAFDRKWKVKITQIPCYTDYTAPTNCLQWYQGVTGQIKSYNYDLSAGLQLSNQDYSVCIRTEKNFCGIQYMACADSVNTNPQSFTLTGSDTRRVGSVIGASNCNKDWLTIPCVSDNNQDPFSNCQDRICGDSLNAVASTTAGNVIVYSYIRPFTLVYHTDSTEGSALPSETLNRGFCLDYVQQPCV